MRAFLHSSPYVRCPLDLTPEIKREFGDSRGREKGKALQVPPETGIRF